MNIVRSSVILLKKASSFVKNKQVKQVSMLVLSFFFTLSVMNAYAQEEIESGKIDVVENYNQVDVSGTAVTADPENNVDKTTENQWLASSHTLLKTLCGVESCFEVKDEQALSQLSPSVRKGMLGIVNENVNAMLMNPPLVDIPGHLAQEWVPGYSPSASTYASGYSYLSSLGITSLWNTVRTIAYIFFVVVLIAAGFMIMFRKKIGGQLPITIFNTLPNVVIGLIMATFSFALVGVMIDIGGVLTAIIASILQGGGGDMVVVSHPFSLFGMFTANNVQIFGEAMRDSLLSSIDFGSGVDLLGGIVKAILLLIGLSVSGLVGVIVMIILVFVIGMASIKVWWTLLRAYLGILMDTVLSPLVWAIGAIPGNSAPTEWFRRIAKNVLTFPVVFFFINLGLYLLTLDMTIGFPGQLTGADVGGEAPTDGFAGLAIKFFLPIMLMFLAAETPNLLNDFLPANGGKGAADAAANVRKGITKLFGGE